MLALLGLFQSSWAMEARLESFQQDRSFAALERGAESFMNMCRGCHGLKYVKYRDLATFGIDAKKVDTWRSDQPLETALVSLLPDDAAMQAFGLPPPDLSLITKARQGGASHVYSYLIGYYPTPEGLTGNRIFPDTKMPDAFGIAGTTDPVQLAELQGNARDVVSFLAWAADPHEQERYRLGYYVIGYLLVLTLLLYFLKDRIWSRLK